LTHRPRHRPRHRRPLKVAIHEQQVELERHQGIGRLK
jgi:hypothetical protein